MTGLRLARRVALLQVGGDHACMITERVAARYGGEFRPLRMSDARHLVPGHDSAERPETDGARRPGKGG